MNKTTIRFREEEDDFLIRNYENIGLIECSKKLQRHRGSVSKRIRILNLRIRKPKNNIENFREINSPEKAYFLGFFWADGTISSGEPSGKKFIRSYRIDIVIQERDGIAIKDIFCKNIKFNVKMVKKQKETYQNTISFRVNDKELHQFFIENGYRSKSYDSPDKILSKIPDHLKHYWWRGYFDGDGSAGLYNGASKTLNISSSYNQDWAALEKLAIELGINGAAVKKTINKKGHKSSCWKTNNSESINKFFDYIYKNYNTDGIGLKRKYEKYLEARNHEPFRNRISKNRSGNFNLKCAFNRTEINIRNIETRTLAEKIEKTLDYIINES